MRIKRNIWINIYTIMHNNDLYTFIAFKQYLALVIIINIHCMISH